MQNSNFCGKFKCGDNDVKNVFVFAFKKANKALLVVFLELALTNSNLKNVFLALK